VGAVRYLWSHLFIHIVAANINVDAKSLAINVSLDAIKKNPTGSNGSGGIYLVISALAKCGGA
jgi:hypothetical protein